jgi:energy-coupling factor transporter ATP-binding protein EcfA2
MSENLLTRIEIQDFTAFSELRMDFCPGINLLIGNSGTGKSHLLKLLYCACRVTITGQSLLERLLNSFMPSSRDIGRLVHWGKDSSDIAIYRGIDVIQASLIRSPPWMAGMQVGGEKLWYPKAMPCAFLPTNDILSNAPGFLSLWDRREVYFEEEIADLVRQAYLPELNKLTGRLPKIVINLEAAIRGRVEIKGEEFFLVKPNLELEFSLASETVRQLGLLWLLIRNGTIGKNSIIFWDEPTIFGDEGAKEMLVKLLLETASIPCQIFLSSHDDRLIEYFSSNKGSNEVAVHRLVRNAKTGQIALD